MGLSAYMSTQTKILSLYQNKCITYDVPIHLLLIRTILNFKEIIHNEIFSKISYICMKNIEIINKKTAQEFHYKGDIDHE